MNDGGPCHEGADPQVPRKGPEENHRHALSAARAAWQEGGVPLVLSRATGKAQRTFAQVRAALRPTFLEASLRVPWTVVRSAQDGLAVMHNAGRWPTVPSSDLANLVKEAQEVRADILGESQVDSVVSAFSPIFDVEAQSALLIYALCRLERPSHVVETGVARGLSTSMILAALERNRYGTLTSFDVTDAVGALVPPQLRTRWRLTVLDGVSAIGQLESALQHSEAPGLFLHDSDHDPGYQSQEYRVFRRAAEAGAIFLSDDVESGKAFERSFGDRQLLALVDSRKCLGVAWAR